MSKIVVEKRSTDNKYFHQDFHISLNEALKYLAENYGEQAVTGYINKVADVYYSPLSKEMTEKGLAAMKDYLGNIYHIEEADDQIHLTLEGDCLAVRIDECPGVRYLKSRHIDVTPYFIETTGTLCARIAENAGFRFELQRYDHATGAAQMMFMKGEAK